MNFLVCVLNHYKRDKSLIEKRLKELKVSFNVFTDNSDCKESKATRWLGLVINYLKILRHKSDYEWKVIIHDDISMTDDLFEKIDHILKYAPKAIISFYNPTNKSYLKCNAESKNVLRTYSNWWSQCHAFPKEMEAEYLEFCDQHKNYVSTYAEDGLLSRYCSLKKIPIYAVVPSLIQHEGYAESTFNLPAKVGAYERNSATYDPDFNVKEIVWTDAFNNPFKDDSKKYFDK